MEAHYEEYWHQAMQLKHQTHDLINDRSHPMARVLQHETTQLVDDIELRRKPQSIEDRIEHIQHQLIEARAQGEDVLDYSHNRQLHRSYNDMRVGFQRLPRYQ